jgi:hypothetical protein
MPEPDLAPPIRRAAYLALLLAALFPFSGCATVRPVTARAPEPGMPFAAATELTATLVDPVNITLSWQDNSSNEAGYFVEYSPNADGDFVIIEALPPNATRYRHVHLLPHTRFVYRVRPFFGEASNAAEFTTGKDSPQQTADPAPSLETESALQLASLRSTKTITAAAPTNLLAVLVPPAGVKLQWHNHASDADGYVFEIKPPWDATFKVSGFLKPDTRSLVTYGFPFETRFAIRVRAFFYGPPSNVAEQTTGSDRSISIPVGH